jgi:hypothetical protein
MEVIGTLKQSINRETGEGAGWVTFKDAKGQIRAFCRKSGLETIGFFRPRSENRGQLLIQVKGGSVSVKRQPGAEVRFTRVTQMSGDNIPTDVLAAVMSQAPNL